LPISNWSFCKPKSANRKSTIGNDFKGIQMSARKFPRRSSESSAEELIPKQLTLPSLKEAAADCRACDLWKKGTQTVFGDGRSRAKVMFVGEQPGNEEDLTGKPFVGPAGKLFDSALAEAGINRKQTYVTNVVKHFKWEPRGKRRIHKKPNAQEISACRPWLESEIALVKPKVIVALGATAAQALLGSKFRVTKQRGQFIESTLASCVMATVHPSSVLRAPDDETRHLEYRRFVNDLKKLARVISCSEFKL
jgi:uracil-DNA glycosylase family protein